MPTCSHSFSYKGALLLNVVTSSNALSVHVWTGSLNMGKSVHGLGMKLRLEETTFENAFVDMHAKCHMIGDA